MSSEYEQLKLIKTSACGDGLIVDLIVSVAADVAFLNQTALVLFYAAMGEPMIW